MKKHRTPGHFAALALPAVLLALFCLALDIGKAEAHERRSFFERLFGHRTPQAAPPPVLLRPRSRRPKYHSGEHASSPPAPAAVRKNKNAKRVLVVGDFTASALADGLARAYNEDPDIAVIAKTEGSSGFVRNDYYNWPVKITDIIAKEKPDVIVVMLGANDRQVMTLANKTLDALSPEWSSNYGNRILSFTEALKKSGAPWIWLSLPSFKQQNLSQNVLELNARYRQATEKAGGHFVDTWEGFVDENGNFTLSGYDINGQRARLRANDGINFTLPGRRKLAFYAEQAIKALSIGLLQTKALSDEPASSARSAGIKRLAPMGIWDTANRKPGLAGAVFANQREEMARQAEMALDKNPTLPQYRRRNGRADDFSLREKQ